MVKLINGINNFSISTGEDLSDLPILIYEVYSPTGEYVTDFYAEVIDWDCFNGIAKIELEVWDLDDGEYSVSVVRDELSYSIYTGLIEVLSFTLETDSNGVVKMVSR